MNYTAGRSCNCASTAITAIRKEKKARAQQQLYSRIDSKCYFRCRITKYATANNPTTPYNPSKPGKPRNPPAADAAADATADFTAPVTFLLATADFTAPVTFLLATADFTADATAPLVTFLDAFVAGVAVCAKATVDPATTERITSVAKTAEKSFLLIIFHLQNRVILYCMIFSYML
jgi:hypothetical protein